MKVICNRLNETCHGCRHSIPHNPIIDQGDEKHCSEEGQECFGQSLPEVKCIPFGVPE